MRSKRQVNEANKYMTISQLKRIQDNQYRSECLTYDYYPESIDLMLIKKLSDRIDKETNKQLERYNYEAR